MLSEIGRLDWGSVPQWVGLVGAFVAAVAFLAGRLDAARAQARSVYVMVTSSLYGTGDRSTEADHTKVEIRNDSDFPIVDLGISEWNWGHRRRLWRLRPETVWMTGERLCGRLYTTVLPNSAILDESLVPMPGPPPPAMGTVNPPIMLVFRDASGRRWVRWPDGKLSRRWPSR